MAQVERSTMQKVLFVLSIITIILAGISIILGIMTLIGGSMIPAAMTEVNTADVEGALQGTGVTVSEATAATSMVFGIGGAIILAEGIFSLVMGIFGIRGSNDATKIMPFFIMSIICVVLGIISCFTAFSATTLISTILYAACVYIGWSIRQEAGVR